MDWKRALVIAALVKQKVAEVDALGLWQHILPEVAASEQALDALEMCLGESLDSGYRSFLLHAERFITRLTYSVSTISWRGHALIVRRNLAICWSGCPTCADATGQN
ncbi:hypothetical protein [Comamonas koreensis]|uniref:hypothetical protein n=1 Tax=Comamonas koreensis TaxID=160825 RepID=UPI0015FC06D3|nr:hypothetical protein [Comamonas koreensis]